MDAAIDPNSMTIYRAYLGATQFAQYALITHTLERETGIEASFYRDLARRELAEVAGLLGFTLTPIEVQPAPVAADDPDFNDDIVDAPAP